VPPVPKATEEESVPAKVRVLLTVRVLLSAIVRVALVAGAVIATLLIDVADATPSTGVTSVGEVANTRAPLPVSSEITPASSAEVVAAKKLSLLTSRATIPPRFCKS
jgi:hypothetical protein